MAAVDFHAHEARFCFLIVGPEGAGKATLLRRLHDSLSPHERGEIVTARTGPVEVLSFDFAPSELLPAAEYKARATLATVPGKPPASVVLARLFEELDGLLFVADCRRSQLAANVAALRDLGSARSLRDVPVAFFYNKRDAADGVPVAELDERLNPARAPQHDGSASEGKGIDGILATLIRGAFLV